MSDDREAIRVAYRRVFSREPRASEIASAERFIQELEAAYQRAEPEVVNSLSRSAKQAAWAAFHQSLLASAEFFYLR